jgi:hypothetical protein
MALHNHKPDGTPRRHTPWSAFADMPGLLIVTGTQLLIGLVEAVLTMGYRRGSWATDPVPWIHGPPLDVPIGRGSPVTYFQMFIWTAVLVTVAWTALVARPDWPGPPQKALAVMAALLVPVHLVILWSLL